MKCPTCGKQVPGSQEACSFCGGLVRSASPKFGAAGPSFISESKASPPHDAFSSPAPAFEGDEATAEEVPPARELQAPAPRAPQPPPRPPVPSLIRVLAILAFFLVPLFNYLLRDFTSNRQSSSPVLREAIFCENVVQGLPKNPKAVFSLKQDPQIVFYSRWSGLRGNHSLLLRWYTPQGTPHVGPKALTLYEIGGGGFSASSVLPLQLEMPLGKWKVEVLLDREVRASVNFELRE